MLQNRVLLCGDVGVGKTTFVKCIEEAAFTENHEPTDLARLFSFTVNYPEDSQTQINLWDLSGDKSLTEQLKFYFKNVDVVIFMFDVTSSQSFESLNYWIDLANTNDALTKASFVVLANKTDKGDRAISKDQCVSWAQLQKCDYLEISVKNLEGIQELLSLLAQLCIDKQKQRLEDIRNPHVTTPLVSNVPDVAPRKCC